MYFTALGELLIMLSIMRPEERMDSEVGMLSWASYQSDLRNVLLSGEHVRIIVIRLLNCLEIRNYLGDHNYNRYLSEVAKGIRAMRWNHPRHIELYFERPGTIYIIGDEDETVSGDFVERLQSDTGDQVRRYTEMGVRFEPRVCVIRCPEDLQKAEDIISLGHKFHKIDSRKQQTVSHAGELVQSQTFAIEAHIEEIFDRAIKNGNLEMVYQPIYDVRSGSFRSAEALARIFDPEYGMISPAIFIPAAETEGFIIPIGDAVLDQVFRFLSEHDPDSLGLSRVEINLSVAQCMERSLPEKMRALQQKYGIDPSRVVLEITETTFENISEVVLENVTELIRMGYSFALDDYGIGYSSIQRVIHLPLKLIKIDKSMLDEVYSADGRKILEYTVRMMQSIGKQLVVEGAETCDEVEILKSMNCDYIQGFYYSRPLPAGEFIHFLEKQNQK
jgi:EAL domain-containing protein (putative c-di-GMP-specific phosphodiesterase class I)